MSFLAPLFLLGGLTVALPLVFHLIRRTSRERVLFSSLMFLQATPPRLTRRSKLEHILLLLFRCLVIALLAAGFARPFFQRSILAEQGTGGQRIIVLLDTSASMRREGMWPDALARAGQILKEAGPGDQAAVYTFDIRTKPVLGFEQWAAMGASERAAVATRRLTELKPGWAATHLGNALITAAEAFSSVGKNGESPGAKRIVVITDQQAGSRLDGLQGYDWPRGITIQMESIQPRKPTNAGLQWVMDADEAAPAGAVPVPRLRVSNSANAVREQFKLQWDGVTGTAPLDVYVPPGQSRILAAPKLPANTMGERLRLTGDDDDFDNTVYVLQPKAEQIKVVYVGNETEQDPAQPLYYLKRALQPTRRETIDIQVHSTRSPLPTDSLAGARLIIVAENIASDPQSTPAFAAAIHAFLENGGTVLCVAKNMDAVASIGSLANLRELQVADVTAPNYAMLGQIDFEDPLFAPFADPRFSDFTKIHFWKYRRLDPAQLPGARVVARFDDGAPALLEMARGKGRLLVLTSGWQPEDSQLALSSKFVPLLFSMMELGGGARTTGGRYYAGDTIDLQALGAATAGQATVVRKPDGTDAQMAAGQGAFSGTDAPGIYAVTSIQPPIRFAVNVDPAESRTALLPAVELERLGLPLKSPEVPVARQNEQKRRLHDTELEDQQKLWRWLTLAALVLLLGETWLAWRLTRGPAPSAT